MSARERVLAARLIGKIDKNNDYAEAIGLSGEIKRKSEVSAEYISIASPPSARTDRPTV